MAGPTITELVERALASDARAGRAREMAVRVTAPIADLIAASSVGAALADIKERGIDAHLVDLAQEMAPTNKRKPSMTPTKRCMAELRKRGWTAAIVEKWVRFPPPGHHVDLFGVIDIVALTGDGIVGIQASPGSRHAAHRDKILAEPRARLWVENGCRLELWSWSMRGAKGKQKRWTLRVETYAEMVAGQTPQPLPVVEHEEPATW